MKRKIKINTTSDRIRPKNSEVDRLCASNKKAIKYLKWKPLFVGKLGFKKALIQTIKWHEKENFSDKKVSNKYVI